MLFVTRMFVSSEHVWDPTASSSVTSCRKTRTVPGKSQHKSNRLSLRAKAKWNVINVGFLGAQEVVVGCDPMLVCKLNIPCSNVVFAGESRIKAAFDIACNV
jgi:hypothetical protein